MRIIGGFLLLVRVITAASSSTASLKEQECGVAYAQGPYQFHISSTSPPICHCAQKEQQLEHVTYKVGPRDICLLATSTHLYKHHGISL